MNKYFVVLLVIAAAASVAHAKTLAEQSDIIILSSKEVQCHQCLDINNNSPGCICESAKCALTTPYANSTEGKLKPQTHLKKP
jgi:hypothetical protein